MFVVYLGSILTTVLYVQALGGSGRGPGRASSWRSTLWLWFTVLFANFAESDRRGPRQGPGGLAAPGAPSGDGEAPRMSRGTAHSWSKVEATICCARAMWCWSRRAISSPPTVR